MERSWAHLMHFKLAFIRWKRAEVESGIKMAMKELIGTLQIKQCGPPWSVLLLTVDAPTGLLMKLWVTISYSRYHIPDVCPPASFMKKKPQLCLPRVPESSKHSAVHKPYTSSNPIERQLSISKMKQVIIWESLVFKTIILILVKINKKKTKHTIM